MAMSEVKDRRAKRPKSQHEGTNPLWFKDAVVYQLHVRAFYDSNGDGVGDFRGLTEKLDYIHSLGVTAIWLLPFFPSPLRDDGYDIADYMTVHPTYGTLADFKKFLREAHRRELRVITELVMNHTSDQHEWFQRSRRAKPGSKWREYYVWSDDPHRYADARIIFQDFESSNWTWDPAAEAYFWHRFYSHQPDLNFDNPEVREAMLKLVTYWLDMGVDGLRLDAVPYLYEREGTNCENLPETHEFLREVRRHVDERFPDKMLLAEANQWPEDAAAYFGAGDECHMNFHFPLMPRLFMAIEREDRFPIIDIMDQTPKLPESCQWAIFLRNHDELTLEMVTDEERDYMYRAYADDPQSRINLGIRRRLAPLLENNRRKMELMTGLLLSLPGTPIVYYGDEIGMGDNIYLGDRNGVRTPMQWNSDRNAGFSRANPQSLYLPTVIDDLYHFTSRNVELEHNSPHSILWWTRRIINLREQFRAFGRGEIEFLTPECAKVLAFLRRYNDETLLIVANLSRFAQSVELDLSAYRGQTPVELFGQTKFPAIGELPYFLTLGPHSFYWFQLKWKESEDVDQSPEQLPTFQQEDGSADGLFDDRGAKLVAALRPFVVRHRWFAGKAKVIQSVELLDAFQVTKKSSREPAWLILIQVAYVEGDPDYYLLPVIQANSERATNIIGDHPSAGILALVRNGDESQAKSDGGNGRQAASSSEHGTTPAYGPTLCDATWEVDFWLPLMDLIRRRGSIKGIDGTLSAVQTKSARSLTDSLTGQPSITVHGGQQSNTSVVIGQRLILKLFRRVGEGINPDFEIGQFLTEEVPFPHVPAVAGALEYRRSGQEPTTLAILHEYKSNEGDAWVYTLDELSRFCERIRAGAEEIPLEVSPFSTTSLVKMAQESPPASAPQLILAFLPSAELLGRRTAQMHVALAGSQANPDFEPEPFSQLYQRSLYQTMRTQARTSLQLLKKRIPSLPEHLRDEAAQVAELESEALQRFRKITEGRITALRIRCHGDFHLGQVLFTGKDFVIIDFEGEPDRPISQRRIKMSALHDVAGMIRSFHYATHAALLGHAPGPSLADGDHQALESSLRAWYLWTSATFLRAYLDEVANAGFLPNRPGELELLLDAYILNKLLYELQYELNNRPDWIKIPLRGIVELVLPQC